MTVPPTSVQVDTGHHDMIVRSPLPLASPPRSAPQLPALCTPHADHERPAQHDAQLDYYGRRLATASSDRTIRIFDVDNDDHHRLADTLQGCARPRLPSSSTR